MTFREHPQRVTLENCDLRLDTWGTDYISDNWEQQYEQLHFDLWIQSDGDSIRNSCDVFFVFWQIEIQMKIGWVGWSTNHGCGWTSCEFSVTHHFISSGFHHLEPLHCLKLRTLQGKSEQLFPLRIYYQEAKSFPFKSLFIHPFQK